MKLCEMLCCTLAATVYQVFSSKSREDVDPTFTIVSGAGLDPTLVFPVRYFFIQAVDKSGKNFTDSPGDIFAVTIAGLNEPCRIWTQVLDRHDGSFIVRYRLFQTCRGLKITVELDSQPVGQSPYQYNDVIYNEDCYCPIRDVYNWQDVMGCPTIYQQIEDDLAAFPEVDMDRAVEIAVKRFGQPGSFSICNYVVLSNQVYRKCYGQHIGFKMFMDNILLSVTRKMVLPDMDLLVNLGDWPLIKKGAFDPPLPMFSWCGSKDAYDVVMPTYDLTESTLETMGRVTLDMMSIQSNTGPKWKKKTAKGFWRGRDSRRERLQLVAMAREHPELLNASLTNFFFFRDEEKEYGPKVKHASFFDFFEYKYQINIDGTVAAYRMPYLLGGDSAVFKQDSDYYEFFYGDLEPMVHYVPFKSDLSDLLDRLRWAQANDDEVNRIAQAGRSFAQDNLMPSDIYCYHAALFEKYAKKIISKIRIREDMEHVPQPSNLNSQCKCVHQEQNFKEEL